MSQAVSASLRSASIVLIVPFLATSMLTLPIYWLFVYLHHLRTKDRET